MFSYGANTYPFGLQQTYRGQRVQEVAATLPGHFAAVQQAPPAWAAQALRARVLSQVRFKFRNKRTGKLFGTTALDMLENPWPNATTGELVAELEWHAGLAGNAYVIHRGDRLMVPRPDWVGILYGSQLEPRELEGALAAHMIDGELIGYVYQAGGIGQGKTEPVLLRPQDVAHWSPVPDPLNPGV